VVALQTDEQSWLIPIIILNPKHFNGMMIRTPHLPLVSVIEMGNLSMLTPTHLLMPRVLLVFLTFYLSMTLIANSPRCPGKIPLLPEQGGFNQQRYWWIPVNMAVVLVTLQEWVGRTTYMSEEVTCTQNIHNILRLQQG
jgi:hypothetical protein